jgi:hypothetical protein
MQLLNISYAKSIQHIACHCHLTVASSRIMLTRHIHTLLQFLCVADQLTLQPFCAWLSDAQLTRTIPEIQQPSYDKRHTTHPVLKIYTILSSPQHLSGPHIFLCVYVRSKLLESEKGESLLK